MSMRALYFILSLPALIPFYGLISDIAGYVGLWRYWGDWGVFIALLVLGAMKDSGAKSLAQAVQQNGQCEETMALGAGCCVLQTIIIVISLRSFA